MALWSLSSCGGSDLASGPELPVASVSITPSSSRIVPNATVQLEATTRDSTGATLSGRQVTWSSSDEGVTTVSSKGLVTGVAAGNATITATSEGKSETASVEVGVEGESLVSSVVVSPAGATIAASETVQLDAATLDAQGNELTDRLVEWSSSNPDIASVTETGLVTGVADGTAIIVATSEGQSGSATITVGVASPGEHWTLEEDVRDNAIGYSCHNIQALTLSQTGSTFVGTNVQTGTCTLAGESFDNSGTFEITGGQISGNAVTFTEPGAVPCIYSGTIEPSGAMGGTVSCQGSIGVTDLNVTGTWHAVKLEQGQARSGLRVVKLHGAVVR
ncbi:MAG TPA: Ig-like domain-containing protein [Gemmatimonadales bacterium]|nr:Ig-like domain-containing protein [Gemmatimonadales bacterium]